MLDVLRHRDFRRLFLAQVVALVGTGLLTVALALLAYDLAGAHAGAVLGTALVVKMVVYVLLAPVAGAMVPPAWRKRALVALDLARAAAALTLPFVDAIWQVYLLIALLQSASAGFTPLFQSVIPGILKDERDYTRALSLARLAYDLESLLSPAIAAALLSFVSFHALFAGTSIGFVVSAALVVGTTLPVTAGAAANGSAYARAIRGIRIYLRTPRLRGLLALNLVAATGGAMVFVNTVVVVRSVLGGGEREVAWALSAFGLGSMVVALALPRVLDRTPDRRVMLAGAALMCAALIALALAWRALGGAVGWSLVVPFWVGFGVAYAALITPGGRLLRRSARAEDLPFLFAAQFSLSHVCWLVAYAIAGGVGARFGLGAAWVVMAALAAVGTLLAWRTWPAVDDAALPHRHDGLPPDHPHWQEHAVDAGGAHAHPVIIDELHTRWPK